MGKQEFIDRLRAALNGRVSPIQVQENVNYYEDYINMEIRKGRAELEVLQSLGDPRLIARTIIETNERSDKTNPQDNGYTSSGYQNNYQGTAREAGYYDNTDIKPRMFRLPGWAWVLIVFLIIAFIISMVFSVLSFLAPIILPVMVVVFLVKLFRDWLN